VERRPEKDLALLREMADAVARVVKESRPETWGEELGMGADGTPTKKVDDLAEHEILRVLRARKADKLNLLSEEAGFVDLKGDRLVVADPIDGTTNAARGIPFYCVSLAVGRKTLADVDVGLVQNLCTGDRFEAIAGRGATLNGRAIKVRPAGKDSLVGVGAAGGVKGNVRCFGASALEMCLVAQGGLDGYHYARPILRIIDVAASTLIVREAGGVVVDRAGADLDLQLSLVPRFGLTAAPTREAAMALGAGK
jgi:fructose-1,6-bisphosphatase/inositol monophosphatase family enzyme